jgi:hypothetical protein
VFQVPQDGASMHLDVLRRRKGKGMQHKKKQITRSAEAFEKLDELASKLEETFSKVLCISTNANSRVGWYVDSGASRHVTFNKKSFNTLRQQEANIQVELGDDATYLVTGMGSVSFNMPSGNVLDLDDVLFVPDLTKNLLSVSAWTELRFVVEFDDQQVIIGDYNEDPSQVLARGMREGGRYC